MANAAGSGGKSAARLKRRNESKMIMRQPIMLISILTVIVLLLLFVIYPLVKILLFSLTDAGLSPWLPRRRSFPPPGI